MVGELDPAAQPIFEMFFGLLDETIGDVRYLAFEGLRKMIVQEAYFAQGRQALAEVNVLRTAAGLYLLRSERDNYIITWTLKSKHIDGKAMDVLPTDGAGNPTWDLAHYINIFKLIRECGRDAGLECGADWPKPNTDWPHYQIKG